MDYRVTWEVFVSADSPEEAAILAQVLQRDTSRAGWAFFVEATNARAVLVDTSELGDED